MKNAPNLKIKFLQSIFVALLFLFFSLGSNAQRNLRYKDVYKVVTEKSKEEAYSILLVYQKQEPYFANTYFQLGLISQFWSKDYDALTDLKDVEFFIYNTNLYFGLAKSKIDSKEIRKNDKFYLNIERFQKAEKLEDVEVNAFIEEQLAANKEYEKNVYLVTNLFNSSIKHYNHCINIFKEINTDNNKIKDIYLTAGSVFNNKLNELESSFDSAIYYLQNYQTAIKNYPIKNYNQKYRLLPIETYRLHGLTGSDFLMNEIPIWDYGTWVKNVKQVLNGDIKELRKSIEKADNLLNTNINTLLESNEYKEDFELPVIDEKVKYKIGKFDHKSILIELFKYKESKIDFLSFNKNPLNNIYDTLSEYSLIQKARYYDNLVAKRLFSDSLNQDLVSHINAYDLNKYSDFFDNKYGGETGLHAYSKNEKTLLSSTLDSSLENFKDYLIKKSKISKNTDSIPYKNQYLSLPHSEYDFQKALLNKLYVVDYEKHSSGDYYLVGYTKIKSNEIVSFIALSNKLEGVKWFKTIPSAKQNSSVGTNIQITETGCAVLLNDIANEKIVSQILEFDETGKQTNKVDIVPGGFPRYFNYDEINQSYLLVFKGNKSNALECLDNDLTVIMIDAISKEKKWATSLKLKGNFVDLIKMNNNIMVFTNFTEYNSDSINFVSKAFSNNQLNTNTLVVVINQEGTVIKEHPLLNSNPYFIAKAIKLNSNTINLVGFKSQLQNLNEANENNLGDFFYMLLNSSVEAYYDNWK